MSTPTDRPFDLQELLLHYAGELSYYVETKIPSRFQSVISADDVLQEVWVTASRTMPAELVNVRQWLFQVANRRIVDAVRTAAAQKRGPGPQGAASSGMNALVARLNSRNRTPSRELSAREADLAVRTALASLRPEYREVVRMRFVEGLPQEQIARALGKSKAGVNTLVFRGVRELHRHLGSAAKYLSGSREVAMPHPRSTRERRRATDAPQ